MQNENQTYLYFWIILPQIINYRCSYKYLFKLKITTNNKFLFVVKFRIYYDKIDMT